MRTLKNNDCGLDQVDEEDVGLNDMDVECGDDEFSDYIPIESKLCFGPLFCLHFEMLYNQGMVECLSEKSVRIRRVLHPTIIFFLLQEKVNDYFPLFGEKDIYIFTEYKRNGTTYQAHPNYNSFGE